VLRMLCDREATHMLLGICVPIGVNRSGPLGLPQRFECAADGPECVTLSQPDLVMVRCA